jgi:hypothetical protein
MKIVISATILTNNQVASYGFLDREGVRDEGRGERV